VVVPRSVEPGAHAVRVCAPFGAPVLSLDADVLDEGCCGPVGDFGLHDRRTARRALHLAEVLALGIGGNLPGQDPERPAECPSLAAWCATTAGAALTAAVATAAGHRALRALRRQ